MNRRLLSLARGPWPALVTTILSGLLAGWLTIGQARGISLVVNEVFLGGGTWLVVRGWMATLVVVIALRSLLVWVMEVSASSVAFHIKDDLRNRLLTKIWRLGPAYTQGERTGELITAAVEGVETLDAYFSQYLPQVALSALVPLSILGIIFPLDPLSGIVLLVTAPLIPLFMFLIGKGAEVITQKQYETLGLLSAHFLDSLQGLVTLKIFNRSREHARSVAAAGEQFRDMTLRVLRLTFLSALVLEWIATISTAVVAVEVGLRLLHGQLQFENALFLLILAPEFYMPLRMLGLRFHAGMSGTTAAKRIYTILDLDEGLQVDGGNKAVKTLSDSESPFHTISISNLAFTYPGTSRPALQDLDLVIHRGEHIALVGHSGAGKSTLAYLLLRFFQAQVGDILVDGRSIQEIPLDDWREKISWVPQNPHLFYDTVAENLRLARPQAGDDDLDSALHAANLAEFIRSLPQGYETVIGEEGARLSAGQAQRLALARAFLKNAPILILDEPTSSLDPRTEAFLETSTLDLIRDRTVITIAHRMTTVMNADRIIVLQEGRIVEQGTHNELLLKNGVYASLVRYEPMEVPSLPGDQSALNVDLIREEPIPVLPLSHIHTGRTSLNILRLFSFLRGSWGMTALSLLLGSLTIGASIGLMGTSAWLIAAAALHPSIAELNIAIVGVRFFGISRGLARYTERLASHHVTFDLLARLRLWLYERIEPLSPGRLARYRTADVLNRIVADVDALENFYVRVVNPPLIAAIIVIGITVFLAGWNTSLGWVYLGFALLLGLVFPVVILSLSRAPGTALASLRAAVRVRSMDIIQGLADLLVFDRGEDFLMQQQLKGRAMGRVQRKMGEISGLSSAAGILFSNLCTWAILALSIPLVTSGRLDGILLPVLALMVQASFESLQPLPLAASLASSSLASAGRLFEIVDEGQRVVDEQKYRLIVPNFKTDLSVENLSFTYPGTRSPVLQEISFFLPAGGKVAIVGPSGAGKSTLINLLLRFWKAPPGSINLGDQDILELPEELLRGRFNVLPQRHYLFNATIRDNLLLADPGADQSRIEHATRQAGIHQFIAGLPAGYGTLVGERGARLSSGERQRLALAQAFLGKGDIFLLDEPTSNLDLSTGREILENTLNNLLGRSLLVITHRLIKLEAMDEILLLENGRIKERGTHAGLLKQNGLYCQMHALQERVLQGA